MRGLLAQGRETLLTKLLVLVAVVLFARLAAIINRPVVDDALISIAYGKTFFEGGGFRVTPHSEIAEGFSNPTWTLFLGIAERLHFNSIGPAKIWGMLLTAGSLPLLALWGPSSQDRALRIEDALAPFLACSNASFVYWSLGGLENGILVFLVALFGVLVWQPRTRVVAVILGLVGAALALTRPEAGLYVAVIGLPWLAEWLVRARLRPRPTREDLLALAALVLPIALWFVARRIYFGTWLPNTYFAKRAWSFYMAADMRVHGRDYPVTFLRLIVPLVVACGAGLVVSLLGRWRVFKAALASVGIALAMAGFARYALGDWMKEWRFCATMTPFLAYPVGSGISALRLQLDRPSLVAHRRWKGALGALVAVLAGAALLVVTRNHLARWDLVRDQGGDTPRHAKERSSYGEDVRGALASVPMKHPYIGAPDLGYIGVGLRDYEVVDLAGLTNATFARQYGNRLAMRDYLVNEGYPSLLLLWGPSNELLPLTDVLGHYRSGPYGSYRVYAGMTATEDDRCPDGKPSAMADGQGEMLAKIRADVASGDAVRGLRRWRCYLTHRADADLPDVSARQTLAREAASLAATAHASGKVEVALRHYSLCAVVGAATFRPSSSCRMSAEDLRSQMFPRAAPRRR